MVSSLLVVVNSHLNVGVLRPQHGQIRHLRRRQHLKGKPAAERQRYTSAYTFVYTFVSHRGVLAYVKRCCERPRARSVFGGEFAPCGGEFAPCG
eukprot:419580-Pyramimonas_sp.AAC.1